MALRHALDYLQQNLPGYLGRRRQSQEDDRAALMQQFAMEERTQDRLARAADREADNVRQDQTRRDQRAEFKVTTDATAATRAATALDRAEDNQRFAAQAAQTAKYQGGSLKLQGQRETRLRTDGGSGGGESDPNKGRGTFITNRIGDLTKPRYTSDGTEVPGSALDMNAARQRAIQEWNAGHGSSEFGDVSGGSSSGPSGRTPSAPAAGGQHTVSVALRKQPDEELEPYLIRLREAGVKKEDVKAILAGQGIQ